ncbi:coat protein [Vibrio phage 1.275.O._10N.286.54.E11]|nr:coat protein [Vibrio phage 1.275.O._10N.286.54.E11]
MGALSSGKIVEVLFEKAIETYEHQMSMLERVTVFKPNEADYQNANNVVWRPVQQHAPIKEGWDLSSDDGGIIELNYPATLEQPKNDKFVQRADNLRDMGFWERRGEQSGMKQASFLNQRLAQLVRNQGSLFYRSGDNGYDFIAEARALLNERQVAQMGDSTFILNNRDQRRLAKDLADRGTLSGRPEKTYDSSMIGNVAGFDVLEANYLGNLLGGATPDTTVTATLAFEPESTQTQGGVELNVDYRRAIIPVADSSSYNVGDKISFLNGSTPVNAIGLTDKENTGNAMTFTVISKPNGTQLEVFPKPIALGTAGLSAEALAYANVDTQIASGAIVRRLNTDATARSNIFWAKDSIEVIGGDAPIHLLSEFGGMKVISSTMSNGQTMYMAYDGDINSLNFTCRLFTWWGLVNARPDANGVAVHTG